MTCKDSAAFFTNTACEFFPCHEGIAPEDFNCLFCFCPLYALGANCGGAYYFNEGGVKCCEKCNLPHRGELGMEMLEERFADLKALAACGLEGPEALGMIVESGAADMTSKPDVAG